MFKTQITKKFSLGTKLHIVTNTPRKVYEIDLEALRRKIPLLSMMRRHLSDRNLSGANRKNKLMKSPTSWKIMEGHDVRRAEKMLH